MKQQRTVFTSVKHTLPRLFLCVLLVMSLASSSANNSTYYVDNVTGNDNNDGQSTSKAWKTLHKINSIVFDPGDKIYLKRGQVFTGTLFLKGSGTNESPIQLGAYGSGKRPVIISKSFDYSLQLMNEQGWELSDIETTGSDKSGIFIGCTKDGLELNHFRITNCYAHDIGDTSKLDWDFSQSTGGIIVVNGTIDKDGKPVAYNSVFNDVVINNCIVRYNHRWTCISISSGKKNGKGGNANYIKNCTAEFSAADGIRMNSVRNSFIEYCVMYRNGAWPNYPGKNLGGLGAWFWDAENCTIQYCEASHVQAATTDGGAFDIDYRQINSTVQYCYGHDCSGYGVSVFGGDSTSPTINSVVRYNVFANNGRDPKFVGYGDFFVYTWDKGSLNGVKIHNNTSYWNPVIDTHAVRIDADFTGDLLNIFTNNIVYSKTKQLVYLKNDSMLCDNNIYWVADNGISEWKRKNKTYNSLAEWQQNTGHEKKSRYNDPMLISPTYHERNFPTTQFNLEQGSPAINTGIALDEMGNRDFFGNAVPDKSGKYDIGAYEYGSSKSKDANKKIGAMVAAPELPGINNAFSGSTTLLSFIDVNNTPETQSQLTFLKSMQKQYGEFGLKLILVAQPGFTSQTLNNFILDDELNDVVFLVDDRKENIAGNFGVAKLPCTMLISKSGYIQQQWDDVALSAELAMAIENDLNDRFAIKHFAK